MEDVVGTLQSLGFALATGLLIGLERGWTARAEKSGQRVAGFRTFGVLGVIGGVAGMVPVVFGAIILAAAAGILLLGYRRETADGTNVSATNMLVAMLAMGLGLVTTLGHPVAALASAAVITLLLSMRNTLHRWLRGMSEVELRSATRFAIVAFVILPLLPDRDFGPYLAWNPHRLWFVVVLVSGLSFAGYVATRRLGATRGLLATAFFGAIVSSTAVTVAFARRLQVDPDRAGPLIGGITIASAVMFVRVQLLSAVLAPYVVPGLALIMTPALIVAALLAFLAVRRNNGHRVTKEEVQLGNPLDLVPALGLALLVAALAVAGRWAQQRFGDSGVAVLLALTGLVDVDAAVITLSGLPTGSLAASTAALVLSGPILLNTLLKAALAVVFAPNRCGLRAALPLVASAIAAAAAMLLVFWQRSI